MTDTAHSDILGQAAQGQLRSIIERIERLEQEKSEIAEQIKEVYAEASGNGFDKTAIRQVVRLRKIDRAKRQEAEARQAKSAKTGPLKKEIAKLEARIAELEAAQKEREAQLVDPAFAADFAKSRPVLDAHREAAAELEAAMARWEEASTELAALA